MIQGARHFQIGNSVTQIATSAEAVLILLSLVVALSLLSETTDRWRCTARRGWAVVVCGGAGCALLLTNYQVSGLPLNAIICLLIAGEAALSLPYRMKQAETPLLAGLMVPALMLLVTTGAGFAFPAVKSVVHLKGRFEEVPFSAAGVSDMATKDQPEFADETSEHHLISLSYAKFVNEGFDLLRQHSGPDESVVSLDFSNPFSFALQRRPPKDGALCLEYGGTFDDRFRLSADRLFGDAKLVMWPKVYSDQSLPEPVERNYGPALRSQFSVVAESPRWRLYRRRT